MSLVEFGFGAAELDEMSAADLNYWFRAAVRLGESRQPRGKR
ncbi:MAG: hypothetical protein ACREF0_17665 [Acetobacteraceae bacterium]